MGYTHYWTRPLEINLEVFKAIKKEMELVIKELSQDIAFSDGTSGGEFKPEEDRVIFNGYGDDAYEIFFFPQKGYSFSLYTNKPFEEEKVFEFCKTARKPYDLAVMVCLLVAKWHLKSDIHISSDGGPVEWEEGFDVYEGIFGTDRAAALKAYISLSSDGDFDFLKRGD